MRTIVITGTPATGKTRMAGMLTKKLKSAELIRANDIVNGKRLFSRIDKDGAKIVRMNALKRELERRIRKSKAGYVILEGHLLCDIRIKGATAIVIREHLGKLIARMEKRGYSKDKIRDNIVSEATDYCGVNASANYGRVFELMNDRKALPRMVRIAEGGNARTGSIDLLEELAALAKKGSRYVL
ncbi:MAG: AAA family ATPase [Candidatus Micrarchaeota archaeon]|nr:AAA family ATPase [Candidatus Micrarchaeota archaeon]